MKPKIPKFYFDIGRGSYWFEVEGENRFIPLDAGNARMHLRAAGVSANRPDVGLSPLEKVLYDSQRERGVVYAGPLAGFRAGPLELSSGEMILVTNEAQRVFEKPKVKDTLKSFPTIFRIFAELFGNEQIGIVFSWLKVAVESLSKGDLRPGQMLVVCGPSGCGKSLFQSIVTEVLGGRAAKPFRYMIGETAFNSDLAGAEHLMIEDESSSTDIRIRRKFGASVKEFTVNREISVHAKGRQAVTLAHFCRMTLTTNDEPENVMILPPMDESIKDKLILIRAKFASVGSDRVRLWALIRGEVENLRAFLINRWEIEADAACARYGVKAWHHPDLVRAIEDVAPETRLLSLIDLILWKDEDEDAVPWKGTAEELERALLNSPFRPQVEKLLYFSSAAGVFLGRISAKHPERVILIRTHGKNYWRIFKAKDSDHE